MFYLTTHSTHFIYCYMASDIWLRTILIVRKETRCRHIGYSYRLTARVLLYAPSHRQDNTAFVTPVVEHWLEREIAQWAVTHRVILRPSSLHFLFSVLSLEWMNECLTTPQQKKQICYWVSEKGQPHEMVIAFFGVKFCFTIKISQIYTDLRCLLDIKVLTRN